MTMENIRPFEAGQIDRLAGCRPRDNAAQSAEAVGPISQFSLARTLSRIELSSSSMGLSGLL